MWIPDAVRNFRATGRDRSGRFVLAPIGGLGAVLLVFSPVLPGGSLLPTFLPWLGLTVPILLLAALWRRSRPTLLGALLPLAAWLAVFGGHLRPDGDAPYDLIAVQRNVSDENPDPAGTVRDSDAVIPVMAPSTDGARRGWHVLRGPVGPPPAGPRSHDLSGRWAPLSPAAPLTARVSVITPGWSSPLSQAP